MMGFFSMRDAADGPFAVGASAEFLEKCTVCERRISVKERIHFKPKGYFFLSTVSMRKPRFVTGRPLFFQKTREVTSAPFGEACYDINEFTMLEAPCYEGRRRSP